MAARKTRISEINQGFTLIELVLVMLISSIVVAALHKIFISNQNHYTAQLDVTEMQQNIRGGVNIISHEIRMAGFNDLDNSSAKIINAEPNLFYFTTDLNEDGDVNDPGEHIAYNQFTDVNGTPWLGRATNTAGGSITVSVTSPGNWTITAPAQEGVAENIEFIEFFYLDANGNATTVEERVQTVLVTLVARAEQPDRNFQNTATYNPASDLTFYNKGSLSGRSYSVNDNFRRRLQTFRLECRNVGI